MLLLFILLIGMGVLAYLKTPLGGTINSIIGISGGGGGGTTIDTTKPNIAFPNEPAIGPTSTRIDWSTDEPASTQVEYGTTNAYGSLQPAEPDNNWVGESGGIVTHSVVLTGLTPNTTYHYRVKSMDQAGNLAVSEDKTFTTTSAEST